MFRPGALHCICIDRDMDKVLAEPRNEQSFFGRWREDVNNEGLHTEMLLVYFRDTV